MRSRARSAPLSADPPELFSTLMSATSTLPSAASCFGALPLPDASVTEFRPY
jgi:hypothetical protein